MPSLSPNQNRKIFKVKATPVFYTNLEAKTRIVINRGGSGSSKSHSLAQLIVKKFCEEKNKQFLLLRKTLPSARRGLLPLVKSTLASFGLKYGHGPVDVEHNKTELTFTYRGNTLTISSLDDVDKIKSPEKGYNYIWMEEANEFTIDDFKILLINLRGPTGDGNPNQLYMSFNPIGEHHWIKKDVIDAVDKEGKPHYIITEIHSTYRDNPFLPEENREELERLNDIDPNFYKIYAKGEWGKLEHVIYSNWEEISFFPTPQGMDHVICGLDFGYNHPTALARILVKGFEVWVEELIYERGLTNKDLIDEYLTKMVPEGIPLYCDSEDPSRIEEISRAGFNAIPFKKGHGSVKAGIDFVKRFKIFVPKSSENFIKEFKSYSWRVDKKTNTVLDEPVKFKDDGMDAIRGALFSHLFEEAGPMISIIPAGSGHDDAEFEDFQDSDMDPRMAEWLK